MAEKRSLWQRLRDRLGSSGPSGSRERRRADERGASEPTIPPDPPTTANWREHVARPASPLEPDTAVRAGDPFGSWFCDVRVGHPDELWPMHEGKPLWPLCQLNLTDAPMRPTVLR